MLSQWIENDKYRQENTLLLSQKDISFFTGFISLIEIKSVIRRLWRTKQLLLKPDVQKVLDRFSEGIQVQRIMDFYLQTIPVQIAHIWLPEHFSCNNNEYETDSIQHLAYRLGSVLDLRSMDLIQLASAMNLKIYGKMAIDYFLTNDLTILDNITQIRQTLKIQTISSADLINILKIAL